MTDLDEYKRQMAPDAVPEPMCTRLCSYLLEARRECERLRGAIERHIAHPQTSEWSLIVAPLRAALEGRDSE